MALDAREEMFAKEYIANCGNAYQAALSSGYADRTAKYAYEWLLDTLPNSTVKRHLPFKPELRKAIDEELEKIASAKSATAQEVVEYVTSVMRGKSESEIIVIEGVGEGCSEARAMTKHPDEKERLKAAEILAKILGLNKEKIDVTGNLGVTIIDDLGE